MQKLTLNLAVLAVDAVVLGVLAWSFPLRLWSSYHAMLRGKA
jgi:hypothetical protein